MKEIFDKVIYNKNELLESEIDSLEVEYYKIKDLDKNLYGIGIIEKINGKDNEIKKILRITDKESIIDKLLRIFSEYKVTSISSEDIISDFFKENKKAV